MKTMETVLLALSISVLFNLQASAAVSNDASDMLLRVRRGKTQPDSINNADYLDHNCKNIKRFTQENLDREPWYVKGRKFKVKREPIFKYNHAYGIPVIGVERFTDEAMLRACYLIRFIFADNEHFRRVAHKKQMYVVGQTGGYCCPAQMGNTGLTCLCDSNFPFTGIGAPAHEMAHWFLNQVMPVITKAGQFSIPSFVNKTEWSKQKPYNGAGKCKKVTRLSNKFGKFYDYLWNSQWQDKNTKSTKIKACKVHHYFIYTGQQKYLHFAAGGKYKEKSRANLKQNNINLYNLVAQIWPCNNSYIPVCKDAAYNFTEGLFQKLKIGRADPQDPTQMKCDDQLDQGEISREERNEISQPTADVLEPNASKSKRKCLKVLRRRGWLKRRQTEKRLKEGVVEKALGEDGEYDWYLRKCCHTTAKFTAQ